MITKFIQNRHLAHNIYRLEGRYSQAEHCLLEADKISPTLDHPYARALIFQQLTYITLVQRRRNLNTGGRIRGVGASTVDSIANDAER